MPIDDALYSGSKTYFFHRNKYVRVTRGDTGPGSLDPNYPVTIANGWGWPASFGANNGIDAALFSGSKYYFFKGNQYLRVTRPASGFGAGTVDQGYPKKIADGWNWPDGFGEHGIDAALYSGPKCYFFSGNRYIRVTRPASGFGAGTVDPGYPAALTEWKFPAGF